MVCQHVAQKRRTHKPGIQFIFVVPEEFFHHLLCQFFIFRQMILQRKDKPCLRLHRTSSCGSKIFFFHCPPLTVCEFLIFLSRFFQSKHVRRLCDCLGACRIVDIRDICFIGRPVHTVRGSACTVESQPVSIMEDLSPSVMISVNPANIINPCPHALNLAFQDCFVPAEQIYVPRNDTRSVSPCAGTFCRSECGDNLRNHSVRQKLFLIHVI